jgi:uracil-DNA glycosylase
VKPETALAPLLAAVRACSACADLPLGPRPILQAGAEARILIAGQAPGRITHEKCRPFDDPSGNRLRNWLGLSAETFYDPERIAIIPMGFCFPGTGGGGDLPPRSECAPLWRDKLLKQLPKIELTILLGGYAQDWHLGRTVGDAKVSAKVPERRTEKVMDRVAAWRTHWPAMIALPHPSPRNQGLFRAHPWFEAELVPMLQARIAQILETRG